jgi:hypothetical protein
MLSPGYEPVWVRKATQALAMAAAAGAAPPLRPRDISTPPRSQSSQDFMPLHYDAGCCGVRWILATLGGRWHLADAGLGLRPDGAGGGPQGGQRSSQPWRRVRYHAGASRRASRA